MTADATAATVRDTADVSERIRDAAARGTALRIRAGGSWLDAGHPVAGAEPLELSALRGVVEYTPGDLTLTARAATPLSEIAALTGAERQWLTLDPFGAPAATLGATIATATAGPLAHAFGAPRDVVLGVEVVTGRGSVTRAGGRVVKNVAGFDLTRLHTGAWGTLGAITEVTVRLRALPEVDVTYALAGEQSAMGLDTLAAHLRADPIAPVATELVNAALAARLGLEPRPQLLVRLMGNGSATTAQQRALAALGSVSSVASDVWQRLGRCEPIGASVLRLSRAPSRFGESWSAVIRALAAAPEALAHGSVARGIVRVILPHGDAADATIPTLAAFDGVRIPERLASTRWQEGIFPLAAHDRLSRTARDRFDPQRVLNPGIFGLPA